MPLIMPEARYFSIPSAVVGGAARRKSARNCTPCVRSLTHPRAVAAADLRNGRCTRPGLPFGHWEDPVDALKCPIDLLPGDDERRQKRIVCSWVSLHSSPTALQRLAVAPRAARLRWNSTRSSARARAPPASGRSADRLELTQRSTRPCPPRSRSCPPRPAPGAPFAPRASKRIAAKRAAVLARLEHTEHF